MRGLLAIILLVTACSSQEAPAFSQQRFADVTETQEPGFSAIRCNIGSRDYYVDDIFIYHVNSNRDEVVYTPAAEYLRPWEYPRWQYRHNVHDQSMYGKISKYVADRMQPNGEPVNCTNTTEIPAGFSGFLRTHRHLYANYSRGIEIA